MMVEEPSSPLRQIIEGVMGGLEPEGSKLAIVATRAWRGGGQQPWRWSIKSRKTEARDGSSDARAY